MEAEKKKKKQGLWNLTQKTQGNRIPSTEGKKKKKLLYNLVCTPEEVTLEVGKCEAQNRKTGLNSVK